MDLTNGQSPKDSSPPLATSDGSIESQSIGFKRLQGNKAAKDQVKSQKLQEDVLIS